MTIEQWIDAVVHGTGGIESKIASEYAIIETPEQIITFAIRCLGNIECDGSAAVLDAIMTHRVQQDVRLGRNNDC